MSDVKINELNYELYALDFAEGNLQGEELKAMETFLSCHPQLKEEILAISLVELPHDHVVYDDKANLYKNDKAIVGLPLLTSLAIAASLILLFGFVWMKNQSINNGELADMSMVTLQKMSDVNQWEETSENTADLNTISNVVSKTNEPKTDHEFENDYQKNKTGNDFNNGVKAVNTKGIELMSEKFTKNASQSNEEISYDVAQITPIESVKINADVQEQQLEHVAIASNNTAIIETTIEIGALQTNMSDKRLAMSEKKEERKKVFKENVRYVFQNALLPEGVALAINN
ncbi:MAG: hypothetical protein R2753_17250 [Chitinophagales bacterium]